MLRRFGIVLMDQQKLQEAEPLLVEAYTGAKAAGLPPQALIAGGYGACLSRLGRHAEALPVLIEADAALSKIPLPDRDLRKMITVALIDSYEKTGKPDEAQRLRDRPTTRPTTSATTRP